MDTPDDFHLLRQIERVEVPPYLLSRIEAKIQSGRREYFPRTWAIAASVAFLLLLGFNTFVILSQVNGPKGEAAGVEQMAEAMHLRASNQLYHE
ncbi:MAG: hypothetical protein EAZ89_11350 [Bacteroidetes bacterium]|nr:MAG: hypothetical protein EAZ89_11350 [Bacteroidota bacterium]